MEQVSGKLHKFRKILIILLLFFVAVVIKNEILGRKAFCVQTVKFISSLPGWVTIVPSAG